MTEDQKQKLENALWKIANDLRGKMNADDFRDYILGFIFYKYLSENICKHADVILSEDGLQFATVTDEEIINAVRENCVDELGYFLRPDELFSHMTAQAQKNAFLLSKVQEILNGIENSTLGKASQDDFDKLFEDMDLTSTKLGRTEEEKNELVGKIFIHLDRIDFGLNDTESDILGDAYEYLIGKFAAGAGKTAGEFYTPQEVSKILAKIVSTDISTGKTRGRLNKVYDPTCGSGSLLLRIQREVEEVGEFVGQELNRTTYNLARMNMILHGVHYSKFDIKNEDTLNRPQHLDNKFDAVVANPPFSAQWSAHEKFLSDDRFAEYEALAPKTKADFAFAQHMLYHLNDGGTMAVVLPHGVLFRGASEGKIRQHLIENKNWLDAVIGLPANVFYGTSIPVAILVFKKCRTFDDGILFIDASNEFVKEKNQNKLTKDNITKIINTFRERKETEKYSRNVPIAEIKENEYNLNIPRYIDTFEEEEEIILDDVVVEIEKIDAEMEQVDTEIRDFCTELGIKSPV